MSHHPSLEGPQSFPFTPNHYSPKQHADTAGSFVRRRRHGSEGAAPSQTLPLSNLSNLSLCPLIQQAFSESETYTILSEKEFRERKSKIAGLSGRIDNLRAQLLYRKGLIESIAAGQKDVGEELNEWEQKYNKEVSELPNLERNLSTLKQDILKHTAAILRKGQIEISSPSIDELSIRDSPGDLSINAIKRNAAKSANLTLYTPDTELARGVTWTLPTHESNRNILKENEKLRSYMNSLLKILYSLNISLQATNVRFNAGVLNHHELAGVAASPNIEIIDLVQSQIEYLRCSLSTLQIEESGIREHIKAIDLQLRELITSSDHTGMATSTTSEPDVRGLLILLDDSVQSFNLRLESLWQLMKRRPRNYDNGCQPGFKGEVFPNSYSHMSGVGVPVDDMSQDDMFENVSLSDTSEVSIFEDNISEGDASEAVISNDSMHGDKITPLAEMASRHSHGVHKLGRKAKQDEDFTTHDEGLHPNDAMVRDEGMSETVPRHEVDNRTCSLDSLTNEAENILVQVFELEKQMRWHERRSKEKKKINEQVHAKLVETLEELDGTAGGLSLANARIEQLTTEITEYKQKIQGAQKNLTTLNTKIEPSTEDKKATDEAPRSVGKQPVPSEEAFRSKGNEVELLSRKIAELKTKATMAKASLCSGLPAGATYTERCTEALELKNEVENLRPELERMAEILGAVTEINVFD
ncbi:chromosome segregation protein SMC-like [Metarhizium robertsii]|uniref:Involucrin repeat protein n=2 Tax=Metarhizium robertsii TaxID=568076 RepID=E9FA34_METRA|nr:involucrin repeat protein [Metarhizium robertsii ARSEF 23]EFY95432.1 involucrin repeat protein [Metarhizium robertsii ARSEF 23]EXU95335.1 chromosome segregation protein SMC-like [Metarhizium robertsii]